MATKKKMLQAAAGNATGGAALDITDVFSTYLYKDNYSTQTITNGIDLAGEGGLVWIKDRNSTASHNFTDTERGAGKFVRSNRTDAQITQSDTITSFNSDGFSLGNDSGNFGFAYNGSDYASWTFRKAPKFFTCLTYTGTGSAQNISHDLGVAPGCIIVKKYSGDQNWAVYHRSLGAGKIINLNRTNAASDNTSVWNSTAPTSSSFSVSTSNNSNQLGETYVAYLFAHNDGDGEFGPDGDQDIIKCGSYTGTDAAGNQVDLGFEPQFVMVKGASTTGNWGIYDTMRGFTASAENQQALFANDSSDELSNGKLSVNATGFALEEFDFNSSPETYIYIAIRRGPLAPPESATEVFDVDLTTSTSAFSVGFPVDLWLGKETTRANGTFVSDRLRGGTKYLLTPSTAAEATELFRDYKRLENAGAFAAESEVVAGPAMTEIAKRTALICVSLGSGGGGDVSFLFMNDLCGETTNAPRHARAFGDLAAMHAAVHAARIDALSAFKTAATDGSFPAQAETLGMAQVELDAFLNTLEKIK